MLAIESNFALDQTSTSGLSDWLASKAPPRQIDTGNVQNASKPPHILIVDDIAENRAVLKRRFEPRGFKITEAENGKMALDLVEQNEFDTIMLDIMMPDIDGLQLLRELRRIQSSASVPVIMVTARSQSEDVVEALREGADDYITKPVDFEVALARVKVQLLRSSLNKQAQLEAARLRHIACHDDLTGLSNRASFQSQLARSIDETSRSGEQLAILYIDLDGFKKVNDSLGHHAGDELLRKFAACLKERVADHTQIARLGGDEFAILQVGNELRSSMSRLASDIINSIDRLSEIFGQKVSVGASIGIAMGDGHQSAAELLCNADQAMYAAKSAGKGTVRFF